MFMVVFDYVPLTIFFVNSALVFRLTRNPFLNLFLIKKQLETNIVSLLFLRSNKLPKKWLLMKIESTISKFEFSIFITLMFY